MGYNLDCDGTWQLAYVSCFFAAFAAHELLELLTFLLANKNLANRIIRCDGCVHTGLPSSDVIITAMNYVIHSPMRCS